MNIIDICLKEKWGLYNMFESMILLYIYQKTKHRKKPSTEMHNYKRENGNFVIK